MIIIILLIGFLFVTPLPVHAYLDPGTGSYIFQIILASLLAGSYFVRDKIGLVFFKIKSIINKLRSSKHAKK